MTPKKKTDPEEDDPFADQTLEAEAKRWGHQHTAFLLISGMQLNFDEVLDEIDEAETDPHIHDLAERLSSDIDELTNELRDRDLETHQDLSERLHGLK